MTLTHIFVGSNPTTLANAEFVGNAAALTLNLPVVGEPVEHRYSKSSLEIEKSTIEDLAQVAM